MIRRALLLACAYGLTAASAARAQSTITSGLDTSLVTVGDRLTLDVIVEHPENAVVSWPDSVDAGPFELLGARVTPMRSRDGRAVSSASFTFTAFELGELELPPLELSVLHADGREEPLRTDAFGVDVVSVGVDETGDIREIRGPLALPVGPTRILGLLLATLLLAGAGYLLWRRRSQEDEANGLPAPPPPRPAHEAALEALDALERSGLLEDGQIREFHIRVSEILRRYVEARFRVPALEMTTGEVLAGLDSAGVDRALREELRRFLGQCDLVKFAKAEPGEDASRKVLHRGRQIVERSAPRRPEPVGVED